MPRLRVALVALPVLVGTAYFVLPEGWRAGELMRERDAPEAVAEYQLASLKPETYETAIQRALAADDPELAQSIIELGESRDIQLPGKLKAHAALVAAAKDDRKAEEAWNGFVSGKADSEAALAGAIAADLTGYGDIRDLVVQARHHQKGEPVDHLTIGLAAVGVTLTAATLLTVGAAAPAKAGMSTVKVVHRTRRLSPTLTKQVTRLGRNAVDMSALRSMTGSLKKLDLVAAQRSARLMLKPGPARALRQLGDDVSTLGRNTGYRGTLQVLESADSARDIQRVARVSKTFGRRTRGVLAVLGGAALSLASIATTATMWMISAIIWLVSAAWMISRFGVWTLRRIFG
ncbi:hypothetical protein ACKTEK_00855 [Tepidamorphus sp. 3E244]|uniref:hypothetical protein n=1 Tax=Tepidamorphus sp. 3E244 TaxID=3385498 RepID=UPI0038FC7A85